MNRVSQPAKPSKIQANDLLIKQSEAEKLATSQRKTMTAIAPTSNLTFAEFSTQLTNLAKGITPSGKEDPIEVFLKKFEKLIPKAAKLSEDAYVSQSLEAMLATFTFPSEGWTKLYDLITAHTVSTCWYYPEGHSSRARKTRSNHVIAIVMLHPKGMIALKIYTP